MIPKIINKQLFSFCNIAVPSVDMTKYLTKSVGWEKDCKRVAQLFRDYGLVYAMDPRVDHSKNDAFLDQMERYYTLRSKQFEDGIKNLDVDDGNGIPYGLKFIYL